VGRGEEAVAPSLPGTPQIRENIFKDSHYTQAITVFEKCEK